MNSFFLSKIHQARVKEQLSSKFILYFIADFLVLQTLNLQFYSNLTAISQRFLYQITSIHTLSA